MTFAERDLRERGGAGFLASDNHAPSRAPRVPAPATESPIENCDITCERLPFFTLLSFSLSPSSCFVELPGTYTSILISILLSSPLYCAIAAIKSSRPTYYYYGDYYPHVIKNGLIWQNGISEHRNTNRAEKGE